MTKDEIINHNITLTFDFLKQVIREPSIIDDMEDNSVIEFLENDRSLYETKKTKRPDRFFKVRHHFEKIVSPENS